MTDATRALSTELVVRTAAGIADREGLRAVSMRRVASELGCAAMSLYGHVSGKEELLDRVADEVLGTLPDIDPAAPWQDAIVAFFTALHDLLIAHPAVAQLLADRPTFGPHVRRTGEQALAALRSGGLSDRLAVEAFVALSCYTLGAALYTTARSGAAATTPGWVELDDGAAEGLGEMRRHLAARTGPDQFRSGLTHLVAGYAADV